MVKVMRASLLVLLLTASALVLESRPAHSQGIPKTPMTTTLTPQAKPNGLLVAISSLPLATNTHTSVASTESPAATFSGRRAR